MAITNITILLSTIELLVNRINKLELTVSYLNNINIIPNQLDDCREMMNDDNSNLWLDIKEDIPLVYKSGEILRINRQGNIREDEVIEENENTNYKEYQFISPQIFIQNIYNKLEKIHNKKHKCFNLREKKRVNEIIEKNNNDYKLIREKITKEEAQIEEVEYQKALRQAKIEARIQAQQDLLKQEALEELKLVNKSK